MGASAAPPPVPAVTVPPPIPAMQSPQGISAGKSVAARAQSAFGPSATDLTGPNGITTPANMANKTLLGS